MANILGGKGIAALENRGINIEIAAQCGLHTIRWDAEAEVAVPDTNGNVVAFPFIEHGIVVNEKYRAPGKRFWQRKGGKKTFWNADVLDDPALENGTMPLIITEGEVDALSAITSGFPLSVSVPDGAPPALPDGGLKKDRDEQDESEGKFAFLFNNRDRLRRIKRFTLAVDNDPPGKRLAAELVRLLGAARCSFIEYPHGNKDLNDVLQDYGTEEVTRVLNGAKPYPVHGLYRLKDYPDVADLELFPTGWWALDAHLKLWFGEFVVVSGIPSNGKTLWTLNLAANMAALYDWNIAVFSGEMPVVPQLRSRLRTIIGGAADHFINRHFLFIDADPNSAEDQPEFSLEWIIERATDAVLRDGIRMLLIDPWNEIEHGRERHETMTDYIGRAIRSLKAFARKYGVVVVVVAHPTKDIVNAKDGKPRTPGLYDVENSSHWANKADHGVIIEREAETGLTKIWVTKSRFDEAGVKGVGRLKFDAPTWRFLSLPKPEVLEVIP